jgi:uncharacterized coiled-coil protein SlyX
MNPLYSLKKQTTLVFLVALGLVCFGLLPNALAVIPAPDGGYGPPAYGTGNTAEGQNALLSLTTGSYNTGVGLLSLRSNTTASLNTAIGAGALLANTANQNTATGAVALFHNTTGFNNTANGVQALVSNTTGSDNVAIGDEALINNTTGIFNIALGAGAGNGVTTARGVICIGATLSGANVDDTCFIGAIRGVTTINNDAIPVLIDSNNQLGTASSSRRFKKEIKPMDKVSEAILGLKPVTFQYKSDTKDTPQFGLIAEDVAAVNPDLVVRDKSGDIYTVRYDAVNAMLLNEFLKEHRKVEEQEATITQLKSTVAKQEATMSRLDITVAKQETTGAQQQKEIQALTASLTEQAAQIQKVSAQLEASKPALQVVNNP